MSSPFNTLPFLATQTAKPMSTLTLLCPALLSLSIVLSGCGGSDETATSPVPNPSEPTIPTTPDPTDDPTDTNWLPAGGSATIDADITRPFLQIIPSLPTNTLSGVSAGRELFITEWRSANEGRVLFDGLGPLFNATSCSECHSDEGRMPVYVDNGALSDAILFRAGDAQGAAHDYYGGQIQHQSIDPSILPEGQVRYQPVAATDQAPTGVRFDFTPANPNQPLGTKSLSGRISPQLVGMGLIDLIPEANIVAAADPDDLNQDGISGRVHWVNNGQQRHVGRFGWKAINSSLRNQNANAMSQDMGLTTSLFIDPNCTINQPICWTAANGGSPEISDSSLSAVVDFMTALAVPERRINDLATFNKGATLFTQVGCASCHTPKQTTGDSTRFSVLSQQTIYPYTDLLLHDIGAGLDDGVKEKDAESFEWRTPPLWGIGIVARDPDARFLHDGRASSLEEAILWHGGEAETTKSRFKALTPTEKDTLLTFVRGI